MPTQLRLPMQPAHAVSVNTALAILREGDEVAYFAHGVPMFVHGKDDTVGQRVAAVQVIELGLARQDELSAALGVSRRAFYRQSLKVKSEGVLGVVDAKRGPHGPHRFNAQKREASQKLLRQGLLVRQTAKRVGVSESTIRLAVRNGELTQGKATGAVGPSERSRRAARGTSGVAVQRHTDRALARLGQIQEAAVQFEAAEAVRYGGALLALPAMLALGLLEAGEEAYGSLKSGFYGLRATLLLLCFMALLRRRSPEQLQGHPPGELGVLLGLDRAPEVKTLRRKLWELTGREQAASFSRALARRWVEQNLEEVGLLYIDGHGRPYNGTKHKLPKAWVARRKMCMQASTDRWVNQQDAQPLFVVSTKANDKLLAMLREEILPQVRELVGERRVTLAFDREGWSPKFFREVFAQGFDVLTYGKGAYKNWPKRTFRQVDATIDGRAVSYRVAERKIRVLPGFTMREVRRLCDSGHQTSIVTTRTDWPIEVVAWRMFERSTQENFFRYMRQHFALDALVNYQVEPGDPGRTIPNPVRKQLAKELRAAVQELESTYGAQARANPEAQRPTMRGFKIAQAKLERQIRDAEAKYQALKVRAAKSPKRVPIKDVVAEDEIVRLAPEAKHLTDTVKMLAFRAETALVRCLRLNGVHTEKDGRALVREMLLSSADIVPDAEQRRLRVRVHSQANPRHNEALTKLCATLNELELPYPGTDLILVYEAPQAA